MTKQHPHTSEFDQVAFARPPLTEVALALQVAAGSISIETAGEFVRSLKGAYPKQQQQPLAAPMEETFDQIPGVNLFDLQLNPQQFFGRTWLLNEDDSMLVQIQHDRVVLNWRALSTDAEYPRYDQLRRQLGELAAVLIAAAKQSDDALSFNMAEVTYINAIVPNSAAESTGHPDLAGVLKSTCKLPDDSFLAEPEDAQYEARWRIPATALGAEGDDAVLPVGRLMVLVSPGLSAADNAPIYVMRLTARVFPNGDDLDAAAKAMDVCHEWVVRGFEALTTEQMQETWEKEKAK